MNFIKKLMLSLVFVLGLGQVQASESPAITALRTVMNGAERVWDTKAGKGLYGIAALVGTIWTGVKLRKIYHVLGRYYKTRLNPSSAMKVKLEAQAKERAQRAEQLTKEYEDIQTILRDEEAQDLNRLVSTMKKHERRALEQIISRYKRLLKLQTGTSDEGVIISAMLNGAFNE